MEKTSYGRARTCGRDRLVLLQRPAGNLQRSARNNPQPTLIAELKVRRSDPATAATAWRVTAFDQRAHAGILAGVPVGVNRVRAVGGRRLRQVMPEKRLRIGQYRPIKRLRIGLDGLPPSAGGTHAGFSGSGVKSGGNRSTGAAIRGAISKIVTGKP